MKRSEFRKTPNGRELRTNSTRFKEALAYAQSRGREGNIAAKVASYAVIRDLLATTNHTALEQDGSVECPRCGRSGSHRIEGDKLIMVGKVFTEECGS